MTPQKQCRADRRALLRRLTVAAGAVLTVTSCAVDSGPGGLKLVDASDPLSTDAYTRKLTESAQSLSNALQVIGGAVKYSDVSARLSEARNAADRTKQALNDLTPPKDARTAHSQLVVALFQFSRDMDGIDQDVQGQRLCTVPAVQHRVGSATGARLLREAAARLQAAPGGHAFPATIADPGPRTEHREPNGRLLKKGARGGRGDLIVENNGERDAVVSLTRSGKAVFTVYVRRKGKTTIKDIADGTYRIMYTTGSDWDTKAKRFSRDCDVQQSVDDTTFSTTISGGYIRWQNWRYIISPGSGGNSVTTRGKPDDFPVD
ncbi:hypothetical protein [Actinomadura spongiicola]|uniref:hypothetical protein n=1 Tax=Actinomadura spongiicola TaxID=2303421 RepID=UPI0011C15FDE|nr:hypothetical protein [Actinomadura spongiicola]